MKLCDTWAVGLVVHGSDRGAPSRLKGSAHERPAFRRRLAPFVRVEHPTPPVEPVTERRPTLFRTAALQHQRERLYGTVLFPRQPAVDSWLGALLVVLLGAGMLLWFGTYPRREHVRGQLVPAQGMSRIYAPQAAVVERIEVREGQRVSRGERLMLLVPAQHHADGRLAKTDLVDALDAQAQEVRHRIALSERQGQARVKSLEERVRSVSDELRQLRRQRELRAAQVELAKGRVAAHQRLVDDSLSTQLELQEVVAQLLELEVEEQEMSQRLTVTQRELARLQAEQAQVPLTAADEEAALRSELSNLALQKTQLELDAEYAITAPLDGIVSLLAVSQGEGVAEQQPLLSVLPEAAALQAQLFVPTRAIGFVKQGMPVRLMIEAFPHQHFGVRHGQVTRVTDAVILADELPAGLADVGPAYRVAVDLDQPFFRSEGETHALRPGMVLSADIILEQRRLVQWLFAPLLASLNEGRGGLPCTAA